MENGLRELAEKIQAEEQELDMGQGSAAGVAGINSARRSDEEDFGTYACMSVLSVL